jgi:hypothetical protein
MNGAWIMTRADFLVFLAEQYPDQSPDWREHWADIAPTVLGKNEPITRNDWLDTIFENDAARNWLWEIESRATLALADEIRGNAMADLLRSNRDALYGAFAALDSAVANGMNLAGPDSNLRGLDLSLARICRELGRVITAAGVVDGIGRAMDSMGGAGK